MPFRIPVCCVSEGGHPVSPEGRVPPVVPTRDRSGQYRRLYGTSSVLISIRPHPFQTRSHELPVDRLPTTAGASRVASGPLGLHAVATTPAGPMGSFAPIDFGLPRIIGGSAPAL